MCMGYRWKGGIGIRRWNVIEVRLKMLFRLIRRKQRKLRYSWLALIEEFKPYSRVSLQGLISLVKLGVK